MRPYIFIAVSRLSAWAAASPAPADFAHHDRCEVEVEDLADARLDAAIGGAAADDDGVAPQHVGELGESLQKLTFPANRANWESRDTFAVRMAKTRREQRLIGYARISTYGQTLDNQLKQLRAAGCSGRNIYRENVTGARANRAELLRMLDRLVPGDVVTVTRIDRLARSTLDLFGIVKRIVNAQAQFRRSLSRGLTPAPAPGA